MKTLWWKKNSPIENENSPMKIKLPDSFHRRGFAATIIRESHFSSISLSIVKNLSLMICKVPINPKLIRKFKIKLNYLPASPFLGPKNNIEYWVNYTMVIQWKGTWNIVYSPFQLKFILLLRPAVCRMIDAE